MSFSPEQQNQYRQIASNIRKMLFSKQFPSNEELFLEIIETEDLWKDTLLSTPHGLMVYEKFIHHILHEKKNILDARPYFRVRQADFLDKVNPHIRKNKPTRLIKLKINYVFISWANNVYAGPHKKILQAYADKLSSLRSDFITRNMPLILNRIKILYYTYSLSEEVEDSVNLAIQASLAAVDKYVLPTDNVTGKDKYSSVLLSTIIARINAITISNFGNQQVYFYPKEKKKLVSINKLKRLGKTNFEISQEMKISEGEVERLFAGFFTSPLDDVAATMIDEKRESPEKAIEKSDLSEKLLSAISKLSFLEQKILLLKGYTANISGMIDGISKE